MTHSFEASIVEASARWGADASRPPRPADAIDGCVPGVVLEPPDVATLLEMLRWASADRRALVIRGGGTRMRWAGVAGRVDAVLSTLRLDGPIEHCAGDLTVTAAAGARLAAVNRMLSREQQWLPLDPSAAEAATIGGIVATNEAGSRRQQHGTPRDLIIGVEMALADGRRAKAGGRVVKNVAGYDLARLLCGSFGSLAVITSATFKLAPKPPVSRTVVVSGEVRTLADLAMSIAASGMTPSALEIETPPPRLLIRFETTESAAIEQSASARDICTQFGASAFILDDRAVEDTLWDEHQSFATDDGATLIRASVLPADVGRTLDEIDRLANRLGLPCRVAGRAALGILYVAVAGSPSSIETSPQLETSRLATAVQDLRKGVHESGGAAVILSASAEVRRAVDPWGDIGAGLPMMRAVKARFDPVGVLNCGRGPGGI